MLPVHFVPAGLATVLMWIKLSMFIGTFGYPLPPPARRDQYEM